MDASCLSSTLSNSGFVLGTCTGGLVEIMYRSFRTLPMLCFTFWHRCFPGGILAGYQGLIFCASGLLLPRPPERLEGPFLTSALTRPWGITLSLHLFLRLLGCAGQATLLLHEPFRTMVLQFLPNLRADRIPRNDGDEVWA